MARSRAAIQGNTCSVPGLHQSLHVTCELETWCQFIQHTVGQQYKAILLCTWATSVFASNESVQAEGLPRFWSSVPRRAAHLHRRRAALWPIPAAMHSLVGAAQAEAPPRVRPACHAVGAGQATHDSALQGSEPRASHAVVQGSPQAKLLPGRPHEVRRQAALLHALLGAARRAGTLPRAAAVARAPVQAASCASSIAAASRSALACSAVRRQRPRLAASGTGTALPIWRCLLCTVP